mmetsp:Transcript_9823/g.17220  ORF Transcript_9823/g.17220 Transcript_9823/m.17220 type:complete len:338 (+) Transcript_9823:60-1073(+)
MFANVSRCAQRWHIIRLQCGAPVAQFSSETTANALPVSFHLVKRTLPLKSQPLIQMNTLLASRPIAIQSLERKASYQRFSTSKDSSINNTTTNNTSASATEQTQSFLLSLGYSSAVSDGIIDALLQNGIPQSSLLGMVKSLAGRYEVGEDGGLEALAASVKLEIEKQDGKNKVKVWCLPSTGWSPAPDGIENDDDEQLPIIKTMDRAFAVEAIEGTTLTDVAQFGTSENCDVLGEYLECACSGIMACSTCHVVIHPDWFDATGAPADCDGDSDHPAASSSNKVCPPSEAEQDMIDLAYEPQVTSRLGCQIKLRKELDGLVILLPRGSNNLMDFVPFE